MTNIERARSFIASTTSGPAQDLALQRLNHGQDVFGDKNFSTPQAYLEQEILEELADVSVWSSILAARLDEKTDENLLFRLRFLSTMASHLSEALDG